MKRNLKWLKLDNAALIYPAARRRHWTNVFRISVYFKDDIDPAVLQSATNDTVARFPSVAVGIKTGLFWYYFEEIPEAPKVIPEEKEPLNRMTFKSIKRCAFRVLYHKNRMSVELFHSVTDGTGAMIFAKTLAAEYVRRRYGADVPCAEGVFDIRQPVPREELEDSFGKYDSAYCAARNEEKAFHIKGTPEEDSFLNVTSATLDSDAVYALAKSYGVTVTTFLAGVMMKSIYDMEHERVKNPRKLKPVRVLIPVDLRKLFDSRTMRNFASYITPGVNPRMGEYSFEEMLDIIKHTVGLQYNSKYMSAKFTANVRSQRSPFLRIMPLFLKNAAMKLVYNIVGESASSMCISNLGVIKLPDAMIPYTQRIDFILGVQADTPLNCGICSYNGKMRINFTRNIVEPELERRFFTFLRKSGLHIYIESNQRES